MNTHKLWNLVLTGVILALPLQSVHAGLISTEQVGADSKIQADREKIRTFMSRNDAVQRLTALGIKPDVARQRVDALTDDEVIRIAGKIDTLPAAGDLGKLDSRLVILIVAIVAILLII
jgi:hypothetical protein